MTDVAARYEAENREMLAHYDAVEVTVVRNAANGNVIHAVATWSNGESDVLYHVSPSSVRPKSVHVCMTRRAN